MILSPSLLSADVGNLAAELSALEAAGLRWVHWDVMDGRFVPNITFGQHVIRQLRKRSGLFFDVHLMIVEPENYLSEFQAAGADMLVVHAEATRHLQRTLAEIRRLGMKAGVALNPATPLSALEYVLEDVDMILLMSVNPGFGGQKFLPIDLNRALHPEDIEEVPPLLAATPAPFPPEAPQASGPDNEKDRLLAALRACGGNRTRAARELGMDRTTLWRKLQKYIQK